MRNQIRILSIACVLSCFMNASVASGNDQYWISFIKPIRSSPLHLMKIDNTGKIVVNPSVIRKSTTGGHTALAHGPGEILLLWILAKTPVSGKYSIRRLLIKEKSLKVVYDRETGFKDALEFSLNVTKRKSGNFLSFTQMNDQDFISGKMVAFGLDENGRSNGSTWDLFEEEGKGSAVSADGRMATLAMPFPGGLPPHEKLLIRPLDSTGQQSSDSLVFVHRETTANDISNPLPNGKRFVVFSGSARTREDYGLFISVVDAKTGEQMSEPIPIYRSRNTPLCDAVIDPKGHFVLYSPEFDGPLFYQALDATGHASGAAKVLIDSSTSVECYGALDILRD